jgi:hypothetical protein
MFLPGDDRGTDQETRWSACLEKIKGLIEILLE